MTSEMVTNLSALRVSLLSPSIKVLALTTATAMPYVELQLLSTMKTLVSGLGFRGWALEVVGSSL